MPKTRAAFSPSSKSASLPLKDLLYFFAVSGRPLSQSTTSFRPKGVVAPKTLLPWTFGPLKVPEPHIIRLAPMTSLTLASSLTTDSSPDMKLGMKPGIG